MFVGGKRVADRPTPYYSSTTGASQDVPYSRTEAQLQLREAITDEGYDIFRLEGEEAFDGTQFKSYVDESLPGGENYREVVFEWDNAPGEHSIGHFDNPKAIAHALVRDRKLADGSTSLHVDELQSDLHTRGSQEGYLTPPQQRGKVFEKLRDFLKDHKNYETSHVNQLQSDGSRTAPGLRDTTNGEFISFEDIGRISNIPVEDLPPAGVADALAKNMGEDLDNLVDIIMPIIDEGPVPHYPFKDDWYEMGLKNLLLDAVNEGKDTLSVSSSAAILDRYSERARTMYETLYDKKIPSAMKKLANKYGGKFEQGILDVQDTFNNWGGVGTISPQSTIGSDVRAANIIRITPEMKQKILAEGLPSFGFAKGGLVNSKIEMPANYREGGRVRLI